MSTAKQPPRGWLWATPLQGFSSLNELSLFELIGIPIRKWKFYLQFDFNLHTPFIPHSKAYLSFHLRNKDQPPTLEPCYTIVNLKRWCLDVRPYSTIEDFLNQSKQWHRSNYRKSQTIFSEYGALVKYFEGDWSSYVEEAYALYTNVADKYGEWLYDLHFFKEVAKRPDYKLLSAWFEGKMIAMTVIQEEAPTLHSTCGGFDYHHSSASCAYSWLNYALIDLAIHSEKFHNVDIGITADTAKSGIGYHSVPTCMDVYCQGFFSKAFLKFISRFVTTTFASRGGFKSSLK